MGSHYAVVKRRSRWLATLWLCAQGGVSLGGAGLVLAPGAVLAWHGIRARVTEGPLDWRHISWQAFLALGASALLTLASVSLKSHLRKRAGALDSWPRDGL